MTNLSANRKIYIWLSGFSWTWKQLTITLGFTLDNSQMFPSSQIDFPVALVTSHYLYNIRSLLYLLESLCVFVCVCLHDNSKRNRSRNTKSEYIVVYENSSDEFDIELHRIKVKVTVGVQKFPHLP